MQRAKTRKVQVGSKAIGGDAPITVQSMTNTDTRDVEATVAQIHRLEEAGCDIIRCTVQDQEAAEALAKIIPEIHIPLAADIHFDYRLALKSIENGVAKLRINPGNIGKKDRVRAVVEAAQDRNSYSHKVSQAPCGVIYCRNTVGIPEALVEAQCGMWKYSKSFSL